MANNTRKIINPHLIKVFHKDTYPAISPLRPEVKQTGKTVLVTGGATGIGYGIAQSFAQAGAARVIIVARRTSTIDESVKKLGVYCHKIGASTEFLGRHCDVSNTESAAQLWAGLDKDAIGVDVLVLCAASISDYETILERSQDRLLGDLQVNALSLVNFTKFYYSQKIPTVGGKKAVVNVSSAAIHTFYGVGADRPSYNASKNAGALLLQLIAKEVSAEHMQIVSYHPGAIFTEAAAKAGFGEADYDWDKLELPANFAVWAASPEAEFLHGRFVWAAWDIDEIRSGEVGERIKSDINYLKVGVVGL